jgi:major membrane immunogen (membrane-anchored lipoprotein)
VTRLLVLTAAAVLLLAGCGGNRSDDAGTGSSTSGAPATTQMTDAQSAPERLVVAVTIKDGTVTPTNEQLQAKVKQPIVIQVDSDAADELHVHSTPEHSFPIAVGPGQSFQFSVDMPGRVDVELHELNKTIATIAVQ